MNRREALSTTVVLLGGTIVGADIFLSGCKGPDKKVVALFTADDITLLDEIGETILPATPDSPGAKAARIGEFMNVMVTDCYSDDDQQIFLDGIRKFKAACAKSYQREFSTLAENERQDFLVALDNEARHTQKDTPHHEPTHYFTMIKQLTLWGYFTSEPGATKALRYVAIPGRYDGCVPYTAGEKAWAT